MRRIWFIPWTIMRLLVIIVGGLGWGLAWVGNKLVSADIWLGERANGDWAERKLRTSRGEADADHLTEGVSGRP